MLSFGRTSTFSASPIFFGIHVELTENPRIESMSLLMSEV